MRRDANDVRLLRELHARLVAAGVFARSDARYMQRLALIVPLWVAVFGAVVVAPVGARVVLCPMLALLCVQLGMLGHDAGHRQIHRDRRINDFWGHVGMTLICGQSFGYWRWRHELHHRNTHEEGRDPDLHYDVVLSVYQDAAARKRGLGRLLRPFQAYYFWPLGTLYIWGLRWDSLMALRARPRETRWDRWLLPAHYALWLAIPSWWLGAFDAAVVYGAVSTVFSLLLMALFAPNHIGMTSVRPDTRPRSLAQRLAVSRNIANPPWLDFLFGGLNAHIEHHLFPGIVAPRLRAARVITRELCREYGLAYHEATLLAAHRDVLRFLMRMARVDQRAQAHDGG